MLRAEKGYIIVGQETDGTVIPADLGLDWAIGKAKRDFVGKRSLTRPDMLRAGPQAAGRAARARGAGGRRADLSPMRRPLPIARARHVGLLERDAAASDRAWRCWLAAERGSGRCCTCRWPDRHHRGARDGRRCSTTGRARGCMAERAHPLLALQRMLRGVRSDCPRSAARAHSRRAERLSVEAIGDLVMSDCAIRTPVAPPRSAIALLWLGPDELLLLAADGAESPAAHPPEASSTYRIAMTGIAVSGSPRRLGDQCILCARSASCCISGRHVHAHRVRQGGDRAVANCCRDVPHRGGAFVRALCLGVSGGGAARVPRRDVSPC